MSSVEDITDKVVIEELIDEADLDAAEDDLEKVAVNEIGPYNPAEDPRLTGLTPVTSFPYKTRPYDHQLTALKRSCFLPSYAYLMEMGTGKSKVIIDNFSILYEHGKILMAVIIAPNSVYRNWLLREIPTHLAPHINENSRMWVHKQDHPDQLSNYIDDSGKLNIFLLNVEAFSQQDLYIFKLLDAMMEIMPTYLCVDESTVIKARHAKRTKVLTQLGRRAAYRRIATGLVAPNGPMDVFNQFQFLEDGCLGTNSAVAFKKRYAKTIIIEEAASRRRRDKVVDVRRSEELRRKMEVLSYRVTKEACLDLPEKTYSLYDVELDDISRAHYEKMKQLAIFEIEHEDPDESVFVRAQHRLSMMMRLQQITCGHIRTLEGGEIRFSLKRIEDTMEFLGTVSGQVVIWSTFVQDIKDLVHNINLNFDGGCAGFYGGTSLQERDKAIDDFQRGDLQYLVVNPAAGRFGTTMTAASTAVYYSNNFDLEHRMQSEDRIHRIGQKKPCLYVDINAQKTLNMRIINSLRGKIDMASELQGDNYRKWLV